jgi:hypothetical protein
MSLRRVGYEGIEASVGCRHPVAYRDDLRGGGNFLAGGLALDLPKPITPFTIGWEVESRLHSKPKSQGWARGTLASNPP